MVVDPDVFAVSDVWELLSRDMQGKAIMCRPAPAPSASMRQLRHQRDAARLREAHALEVEEQFDELFAVERDYKKWINLEATSRARPSACSSRSGTTSTG